MLRYPAGVSRSFVKVPCWVSRSFVNVPCWGEQTLSLSVCPEGVSRSFFVSRSCLCKQIRSLSADPVSVSVYTDGVSRSCLCQQILSLSADPVSVSVYTDGVSRSGLCQQIRSLSVCPDGVRNSGTSVQNLELLKISFKA